MVPMISRSIYFSSENKNTMTCMSSAVSTRRNIQRPCAQLFTHGKFLRICGRAEPDSWKGVHCHSETNSLGWSKDIKRITIWLFNMAMERSTIFKNGKPSISMGHLYHGYVSHNQRVSKGIFQNRCWKLPLGPANSDQIWPNESTHVFCSSPLGTLDSPIGTAINFGGQNLVTKPLIMLKPHNSWQILTNPTVPTFLFWPDQFICGHQFHAKNSLARTQNTYIFRFWNHGFDSWKIRGSMIVWKIFHWECNHTGWWF